MLSKKLNCLKFSNKYFKFAFEFAGFTQKINNNKFTYVHDNNKAGSI